MLAEQGGIKRRPIFLVCILVVLWVCVSWFAVSSMFWSRTNDLVRYELDLLNNQTSGMARDIEARVGFLHGLSDLVARDARVISILSGSDSQASAKSTTRDLNRYLANMSASLPVDVVWVTDAKGDCIAASNAHLPESFVGTNYADRDYFQEVRDGKPGQQYAMGRKTNIPGMFFSSPVLINGRFVGVVATKIDLPKFAHLVGQSDAFVTDESGVVILAHDKNMEMRVLPSASVMQTSELARMGRYKQAEFLQLKLAPWGDQNIPALHRLGNETVPILISNRVLEGKDLVVYRYRRLDQLKEIQQEKIWIFFSASLLGLLAGVGYIWRYTHQQQQIKGTESSRIFKSLIESASDGILVVDGNRNIAAFNQRFIEIWSIPVRMLVPGGVDMMIAHAMEQTELSLENVAKLAALRTNISGSDSGVVQRKDGIWIEWDATAQESDGQYIGRIWRFREKKDEKSVSDVALSLS